MKYTVYASVLLNDGTFTIVNYKSNKDTLNNEMIGRFYRKYPAIKKVSSIWITSNNLPTYCLLYIISERSK
jgi:hypothetical protein